LAYWGQRGDHPLSTDFDADNRTDKTIFRESDGSWWTTLSGGGVLQESWGLKGDIPVPADYDGDGKTDYAVWRPWIAYWAVTKSSGNYSKEASNVIWKQWGLPSDYVMGGDYTGDSLADLVVWRPSNGTWYICSSSTAFDCSKGTGVQFGFPGDQPVHFDMDGDGRLDYAVFRPSNSTWYVRSSATNQVLVKQFGSKNDYPVCSSQSIIKNFIK
jgi:hypothetical protein